MQYAQTTSFPNPHIYYSIGGEISVMRPSGQPVADDVMLSWLNHVLRQMNISQTISISYGIEEKVVPPEYTEAVCGRCRKLGTRGVSVLISSGDKTVPGECSSRLYSL